MSSIILPRSAARSLSRTTSSFRSRPSRVATRCLHQSSSPVTASPLRHRPSSKSWAPRVTVPGAAMARRTMFIQTESTPNPDALKFNPNQQVLPNSIKSPFIEYLTPRSTLAPPHPSPLAAKLLNIDGVTSVLIGTNFITVTKDSATPWAHVKPEVFAIINEFMISGQAIINTIEDKAGEVGQEGTERDSLEYDENDSEVVGMIKELLETRVRPAIQEDGGDIEFRGFVDGQVLLKLRGACRTCDSSTVTLKNGIESMLMHYIEEVQGVEQVLDQEEEIAMAEFAKFEEKLRQHRGPSAASSTVGKGSLDYVD
ncbi:HIRA-interacting protein 5 [Amniculicola lignicola CBS 123094]|uniref:HIRA-interacting protein 5 n=1 Tax=Amniculicola lignicola CBS 123094 TaxID=1392246 RepID=A0A6A5WIZ9_9PLEO|nr:HIRA-interacting protein 5 [Amniculicola lignicola CBS 123094]